MAGCALLATILVILMTTPRSTREWAVGLISTVVTAIGGVAIAVQYFRLQEWVDSVTCLMALGGLICDCRARALGLQRHREESGCQNRRCRRAVMEARHFVALMGA
ncbi:MAG: hypothetical protein V5B35_17810 [Candidatus Accumulibacter necessarius]|uniref:hypothetical protein n=1 Tax=Candidatus Accumulibacter necessarius TaxID=2954386 RepID=UPI002FC2F6A6